MTPKEYVDDEGEDRARLGIREESTGMARHLFVMGLLRDGVAEMTVSSAIEKRILDQCGLESEVGP